jgi:hypothetical protein
LLPLIKGQVAAIRPMKVDVMVLVTARMLSAHIKSVHRSSFSKTLVKNKIWNLVCPSLL